MTQVPLKFVLIYKLRITLHMSHKVARFISNLPITELIPANAIGLDNLRDVSANLDSTEKASWQNKIWQDTWTCICIYTYIRVCTRCTILFLMAADYIRSAFYRHRSVVREICDSFFALPLRRKMYKLHEWSHRKWRPLRSSI